MCNDIIDKCKHAIVKENSFTNIAESIVDELKKDKTSKKIYWTAVVNQFNSVGLKCSQHYYLYIRFDSLAITVLGFK